MEDNFEYLIFLFVVSWYTLAAIIRDYSDKVKIMMMNYHRLLVLFELLCVPS